jgi:hypothetical protein
MHSYALLYYNDYNIPLLFGYLTFGTPRKPGKELEHKDPSVLSYVLVASI